MSGPPPAGTTAVPRRGWRDEADLDGVMTALQAGVDRAITVSRPERLALLGIAIAIFIVGTGILVWGFLNGGLEISALGTAIEAVTSVPVGLLRRSQGRLTQLATLPVETKANTAKCAVGSTTVVQYRQCLVRALNVLKGRLKALGAE